MKHAHFLLVALAIPLVGNAQGNRTFNERVQLAHEVESQPAPREYIERTLSPAMSTTMSKATQLCMSQPGASKERIIVVANIRRDGAPIDVDVSPPTNTGTCFTAAFRELRLAPPPETEHGFLPIFIELTLAE